MAALLAPYFAPIMGLLIACVGIIGVWFGAKKAGKADADVASAEQRTADNEAIAVRQVNEARAAADSRIDKVANANEALNEVNNMSDDAVLNELRQSYGRTPNVSAKDSKPSDTK